MEAGICWPSPTVFWAICFGGCGLVPGLLMWVKVLLSWSNRHPLAYLPSYTCVYMHVTTLQNRVNLDSVFEIIYWVFLSTHSTILVRGTSYLQEAPIILARWWWNVVNIIQGDTAKMQFSFPCVKISLIWWQKRLWKEEQAENSEWGQGLWGKKLWQSLEVLCGTERGGVGGQRGTEAWPEEEGGVGRLLRLNYHIQLLQTASLLLP